MDVVSRTAVNRRLLADFFDALEDDQLDTPSLCGAWSVRQVLGHLVMPLATGPGSLATHLVRNKGSIDRASESIAISLARRPLAELTALLRRHAEVKVPRPMGQMADTCIHLRDCARALNLSDDATLDDWRVVLEWLATRHARGFTDRRRLRGLALRSVDQDWSWGAGAEVTGTSEALAMSITGRVVALNDLSGKGVALLRARIAA
jgi:uncharacterized protein (TIGR03083 family)